MTPTPDALASAPITMLLQHRALPLRIEEGHLHVALPAGTDPAEATTALHDATGHPITVVFASEAVILTGLLGHPDLRPEIAGCDPRLSFACPKTWERLTPTADPLTRRCRVCSQPVRFLAGETDRADTRAAVHRPSAAVSHDLTDLLAALDAPEDEEPEAEVAEVADAAMALILALEAQDPEAATGDLIFIQDD